MMCGVLPGPFFCVFHFYVAEGTSPRKQTRSSATCSMIISRLLPDRKEKYWGVKTYQGLFWGGFIFYVAVGISPKKAKR